MSECPHDYRHIRTWRYTREYRDREWIDLPPEEHTDMHIYECSACKDTKFLDTVVGEPAPANPQEVRWH